MPGSTLQFVELPSLEDIPVYFGDTTFASLDGVADVGYGTPEQDSVVGGGVRKDKFTGELHTNFGRIGGDVNYWEIGEGFIRAIGTGDVYIAAGQTDYNTGIGFWVGRDSGTVRLSLGDPSGDNMTWNGTALSVSGAFAAGSIDIGGADATSFHVDVDGNMWLGAAAFAAAPARVANTGAAVFTSVTIQTVSSVIESAALINATAAGTVESGGNRALASLNASNRVSGYLTSNELAAIPGAAASRVVVGSTGIFMYNAASVNTIAINTDGSLAVASGDFAVSAAGAVTIAGTATFVATAASTIETGGNRAIASLNASNRVSGYLTSNELAAIPGAAASRVVIGGTGIFLYNAASANTVALNTDGSISVATGQFAVDTSGNLTISGTATFVATAASTIETGGNRAIASLNASNRVSGYLTSAELAAIPGAAASRVVIGSTGVFVYNAASVNTISLNTDGSATFAGGQMTIDTSGNVSVNTIAATAGTIGGFTIGATDITATNLSIVSGAANTARITVGTGADLAGMNSGNAAGDIAFWAGDTFANRATADFRVTMAGAVTASSVTITGGSVSGITDLAVADGGTGASTALAGFNALSPITTRGDLITRDATNNIRLAIGAAGRYLRSDGTDPAWGGANLDEANTFFGATDMTGAEAETLTNASNADTLHSHDYNRVYATTLGATSQTPGGVETTLVSWTITGGDMETTGILRITFQYASTATSTWNIKLGGTTFAAVAVGTNVGQPGFAEVIIANNASAAAQNGRGYFAGDAGVANAIVDAAQVNNTGVVNTAVNQTLEVTTDGAASTDTIYNVIVELLQTP